GEVCDAAAEEPAVGSEPGGGSLPVAPAVADAWALLACPTACPLPFPLLLLPFALPLPTATETFPFEGEPWSVVAPAWALWAFELGAPFDPLAWSAAGGALAFALPLALSLPLPVPFPPALPLPFALPFALALLLAFAAPLPFWLAAGCRAPVPAALGSEVTELEPGWLPEGVVGWLSARAAGAATSKTS